MYMIITILKVFVRITHLQNIMCCPAIRYSQQASMTLVKTISKSLDNVDSNITQDTIDNQVLFKIFHAYDIGVVFLGCLEVI